MTKFITSSLIVGALGCTALAQKSMPPVGKTTAEASMFDSRLIIPAIDTSFKQRPVVAENDSMPAPLGTPNNLKAGELGNYKLGVTGPKWPAIGATGWTPADPDLAVGPNNVVVTVNSRIAFFSKSGVNSFAQDTTAFFSGMGAGSFQFDPKCFYDRINGRFVIIILEEDDATQTSKVLMAVSDDSDPNGTWYRYRVEAKLTVGTTSYWLDYPGFGYNKDAYVISGNMFGFVSGSAGTQFLVIPSAPSRTGSTISIYSLRDSSVYSAQVAEMINNTATNVFAVSRLSSTSLKVYSINNAGTSPTLSSTSVTVPSSSAPTQNPASTSGRRLDSLDGRLFTANSRGTSLVTAHAIRNSSRTMSRWYKLNTGTWPTSGSVTLNQSGNVSSGSVSYHMPAINQNSVGDISMIFTRSSTSITADLMYSGRTATSSTGTMSTPTLLESSAGNNYADGRWGDYFGVDVDPSNDKTFYGVGMTVAANNAWRTSVFSWNITP
jgi:hypothetical protein